MITESNDPHILDDIPAYLAGGLSAADSERFDAHIASCESCSAALIDAQATDQALRAIFKDAVPSASFENRIVSRFQQRAHMKLHPMVRRAAIGVAASVLLGAAGFVASHNMNRLERVRLAAEPRPEEAPTDVFGNPAVMTTPTGPEWHHTGQEAGGASLGAQNSEETQLLDQYHQLQGMLDDLSGRGVLPDHPDYKVVRRRLDRVGAALIAMGISPSGDAKNGGMTRSDHRATSEITYAANKALADARDAIAKTDFTAADTALERARIASPQDPTIFTTGALHSFDDQIQAVQLSRDRAFDRSKADAARNNDQAAAARLSDVAAAQSVRLSRTIADLRATAIDETNHQRFKEALGVADQILALDPNDDYATGVRPLLEDKYNFQQQRIFSGKQLQQASTPAAAGEQKAPYEDILRYPTSWPEAHGVATPAVPGSTAAADSIADASLFRLPQGAVNGVTYYGGVKVTEPPGWTDKTAIAPPPVVGSGFAPSATGIIGATTPTDVNAPTASIVSPPAAPSSPAPVIKSKDDVLPASTVQPPDATAATANKLSEVQPAQAVPPAPAQTTPPPPTAPDETAADSRKVIRQGEMSFEVDSFDSTVMTIGKIVAEEGGFVSTTDSDKLANGKVKGTVVLRVPPDRLDTLVLKLRGIGDLKSQKITAQDITKQYTDLESELRAARAMEERLLDIIKNGKGAVKDLLEAEKQLGVWREKIEQVEGEIRYDNSLISLSTLSVSLIERDIKSAAFSSINEQITMALETEKVEEAYNAAKEAIANAKGRIVQSELKQYEAGQFGATIRAQLPPDTADAVVGRLRQLDGRLANFQRQRSQSDEGGSAAPLDASKVKREDVTLNFTIYNLANIEPRRTTSLTLAASNIEEAYSAILEQATAAGARVVSSNINRPRPDQSTGTIQLQAPVDKADALLASMRGATEIISQETTENPDTQNVTTAKRGFIVQIISLAALSPRRSTSLTVAAADVDAAYRLALDKVAAAGGRIIGAGINRGAPDQTRATVNFQVPTTKADAILADLRGAGDLMRQETSENTDAQNTTASARGFSVQIVALAGIAARQSEQLQLAAADVPAAFNAILDAVRAGDGRIVASQLNQQDPANIGGTISFEIARPARPAIDAAIDKSGEIVSRNLTRSQDTDNTVDSKVRVDMTLGSAVQIPPRQTATLAMEVNDVQKSMDDMIAAAVQAGGREIDKDISQDQAGRSIAHVIVELPLDKADALTDQVEQWGHRRAKQVSRNPQAPQGRLARGRIELTFADASTSLGGEETTGDSIRHGLAVSGMGLRWSIQMIVVGLCFVGPWVLALGLFVWGGRRFLRRGKSGMGVPPA